MLFKADFKKWPQRWQDYITSVVRVLPSSRWSVFKWKVKRWIQKMSFFFPFWGVGYIFKWNLIWRRTEIWMNKKMLSNNSTRRSKTGGDGVPVRSARKGWVPRKRSVVFPRSRMARTSKQSLFPLTSVYGTSVTMEELQTSKMPTAVRVQILRVRH